jgi:hypothetical protein
LASKFAKSGNMTFRIFVWKNKEAVKNEEFHADFETIGSFFLMHKRFQRN